VKKQFDKMFASWDSLVGKIVANCVNTLWSYCNYYKIENCYYNGKRL